MKHIYIFSLYIYDYFITIIMQEYIDFLCIALSKFR